ESFWTFSAPAGTLLTENIPILTKLLSLPYNFKSPFRASVYFVALNDFTNLKWGTPEPVLFKDAEFDLVRLRARGTYSVKITEPALFLGKLAGTKGRYSINELEDFLRNKIVSQFFDTLGTNITSVIDLPKVYDEMGILILNQMKSSFEQYGIELCDLKILAITLPEEVQKAIDERSSMAASGDIDRYAKFKAARAIDKMAGSQSAAGGAAVDMGLGLAVGQMIAGALKPQATVETGPHPPSAEHVKNAAETACKKCAAANPIGAKFCMNCAAKISPPGFCEQCSAQNPAAAKFCMNCGQKL
ncbi:MAG TPA: SPFH domain-containing protein, partial [Candidatus Wallbacteria bacterium]|nr:SPFH domain-containing protein [Candidatus Wallbacteria bacterium]